MARGVSVFDLDGTLSTSDTLIAFLLGYLRRNPWRWPHTAPLPVAGLLHVVGLRDNAWVKVRFLRAVLNGTTRDGLAAWTSAFLDDLIAKGLRAEGLREMERRRQAGDLVVLATASVDLYVAPLAQRLSFDETLCTALAWDGDGRFSGDLAGANCYGQEKLARVEGFLREANATGPLTVYSDHHADLPLLRRADRPVAVCPSRRLRKAAKEAAIPIRDWGRPTPG